jgi:hypothetical protein
MKTYKFQRYNTGELSEPISAHSLIEAYETIGVGWKLLSITK